ncbi:hypothetical protein [Zavarzinia sp. CC-PAN008]|uniref:hypothetical protein n=1 Tax=Zavarzinia sp. CC-PAN008 TaxID=3243332 RepID=UPI003F746DA8
MTAWSVLRQIPLIGIVALLYLLLAVIRAPAVDANLFMIGLPSGAAWPFQLDDLVLLLGLAALYFEVLKATRTSQASVADHILSLVVFVVCLLGFLLLPALGTSTFFLIMILAMIDVIAGFTVSISAARRDVDFMRDPA